MTFNKDVVEAIGNTPLIKLKHASEATAAPSSARLNS